MKICLLTMEWPPHGCGIGTYMYNLARGLVMFGHQVTVITHEHNPVQLQGVTIVSVPDSKSTWHLFDKIKRKANWLFRGIVHPWFWQAYQVFKKINESDPFDIIETADFGAWGWHFVNNGKVPFVVRCHTPSHVLHAIRHSNHRNWPMSSLCKKQDHLERMQTVQADGIVAPSEALAYHLSLNWVIPLNRFVVIPNMIDADLFCPAEACGNKNEILYVGRFDLFKGIYDLTHALIPILENYPTVNVRFVGIDSPVAECYRGLGKKASHAILGLILHKHHNRITFNAPVPVSEIVKFQQRALCAVMPTRGFESFSYTVLEPMACGIPVIATRCGGPSEIITNGIDGLLVPPGMPEALTAAIKRLLDDPCLRDRLANNARKIVEERYAFPVVIPKITEWYENIIREYKQQNGGLVDATAGERG